MSRPFPIVRHEAHFRVTPGERWITTVTHEVSANNVPKIEKTSREARRGFSAVADPEQALSLLEGELRMTRKSADSVVVAALRASIGRGRSLVRVVGRPGEDPRAVEASIMDIDGW